VVDVRDHKLQTPLHVAADMGNGQACAVLLEHGADTGASRRPRACPLAHAWLHALTQAGLDFPALRLSSLRARITGACATSSRLQSALLPCVPGEPTCADTLRGQGLPRAPTRRSGVVKRGGARSGFLARRRERAQRYVGRPF